MPFYSYRGLVCASGGRRTMANSMLHDAAYPLLSVPIERPAGAAVRSGEERVCCIVHHRVCHRSSPAGGTVTITQTKRSEFDNEPDLLHKELSAPVDRSRPAGLRCIFLVGCEASPRIGSGRRQASRRAAGGNVPHSISTAFHPAAHAIVDACTLYG